MLKALFSRLPFEWQIGLMWAGRAAIVAAAIGAYGWIDHQGYARAELKWQVKWDDRELQIAQQRADERERMDSVNAMAKAKEALALAAYREQLAAALALNAILAEEAAKDPTAGDVVFDRAAIDRYNRSIAK